MGADTCRFCLRPIDKGKSDLLTETTKLGMLKEFLPEMNIDISENTEVCSNCMKELETSYNFKNGVVVNEANIQAKLEGIKQNKIDLKLMLDDVAKKALKKSDYICRTCLSICRTPSISLFDSPSNMMPYSFVKKMCEVVFELEFIPSVKPVLCDDCWDTLQTVYNFRKSCLRTDKRLRIYVTSKNATKLSIDEFKKFAEQNPVKDEDENSSDEELDGCVKDEPIDEEELKIDPEEASCSSSSVKIKEETEVKSELNSDDEDMNNEPELLDPKVVKSEVDGGDCKMEIGEVKLDTEAEGADGTSGQNSVETLVGDKVCTRKNYSNKSNLLQLISDKKKFSCSLCPYTTSHKGKLGPHLETHKPKSERQMFTCPCCPKKYISKRNFLDHILRVHKRTCERESFSCLHCPYKTINKYNLHIHQEIHKPNSERQMFTCTECSKKYKTKPGLLDHISRLHKKTCETKNFSCSHCPFKTIHKTIYRLHQESHKPSSEKEKFTCADCSKKYTSKRYLVHHIFREHKQMHETKDLLCSNCPYKTTNIANFLNHQETHKPKPEKQMFTCAECSVVYTEKRGLLNHIFRVHKRTSEMKSFSCSHCPYRTLRKTHFRRHLEIHKPYYQRQMFTCAECSKMYTRKRHLMCHIRRMHNRTYKPKIFFCLLCPYETTNETTLLNHQEIHKPKSEREMFTCEQCSKVYQEKRALLGLKLRVHKRTYEIKSCSCPHSTSTIINKSNFQKHQENLKPNSETQKFTCAE